MRKKSSAKRTLKKQKYNIILLLIIVIVAVFLIGLLSSIIKNRKLYKYDNEIVVLKDNGSEIDSISLKELRKNQISNLDLTLNNQSKKTSIEGVSLEKIINSLNLDTTKYTKLETTNKNGGRNSIAIDKALEPDRVYLVYKINEKPVHDYNKSSGVFAIIDTQSKDSSDWILDVKEINLK
ncbi:MAG: oxidoreductase [Peptoniphilaceae bacterium]|nr:oxidoreductase [Peptoniphilaceae bacterium]MDY6019612.1 oxidoreductase [Anaerococcus sp.]